MFAARACCVAGLSVVYQSQADWDCSGPMEDPRTPGNSRLAQDCGGI